MTDPKELCERLRRDIDEAKDDQEPSGEHGFHKGLWLEVSVEELEALLARVEAMRPYLQHTEWCGTPAYGQALVSNSIVHGNRLPVGGQGSCVEFNYERICTCGLDAAINQERPGTGTA